MAPKPSLTDKGQAYMMLLTFLLPPLMVWMASGMPTDKVSLGFMFSMCLSGILAFIKEISNYKPAETTEDVPSQGEVSESENTPLFPSGAKIIKPKLATDTNDVPNTC